MSLPAWNGGENMNNNENNQTNDSFMNGYMAIEKIFNNLQYIEKELGNTKPSAEVAKLITDTVRHFQGEMFDVRDLYAKFCRQHNIFIFDILVMENDSAEDPGLAIITTLYNEVTALQELVKKLEAQMDLDL